MRVLVTGSRDWHDIDTIRRALASTIDAFDGRDGRRLPTLVHGGCRMRSDRSYIDGTPRGADAIADAVWRSWGLPVEIHFARWAELGGRAGYARNAHMVNTHPDRCLAFILNASPGATHCAGLAFAAGIPVDRFDVEEARPPGRPDRRRRDRDVSAGGPFTAQADVLVDAPTLRWDRP